MAPGHSNYKGSQATVRLRGIPVRWRGGGAPRVHGRNPIGTGRDVRPDEAEKGTKESASAQGFVNI